MCYHSSIEKKSDGSEYFYVEGTDFKADELVATPGGIATATKFFRNFFLNGERIHASKYGGDFFLNALLGIYGDCKFIPDIKPSVRRWHQGGVWTSKSEFSKNVGLIKSKFVIFNFFEEKNDLYRTKIAMIAIRDAINSQLKETDKKKNVFIVNLSETKLSYRGMEFYFHYKPFVRWLRRKLNL
jgi:hypothetical protein